jgi:hypothetical protein
MGKHLEGHDEGAGQARVGGVTNVESQMSKEKQMNECQNSPDALLPPSCDVIPRAKYDSFDIRPSFDI